VKKKERSGDKDAAFKELAELDKVEGDKEIDQHVDVKKDIVGKQRSPVLSDAN